MFEQVADLIDEMGGEDHSARVVGVVLKKAIVENLASHGIQPQVGLIEEGERCARGEADDDADGGELAARQFLDAAVEGETEVGDQAIGELLIPVSEEPRGCLEDIFGAEVFGVALAFFDEAGVLQNLGVLDGGLPEQ